MGLGCGEGVTHNTIRHGPTTLFAALDGASGEVIAECKPRHRHKARPGPKLSLAAVGPCLAGPWGSFSRVQELIVKSCSPWGS